MKGRRTSYSESGEKMELGALIKGGFDPYSFYSAFYRYHNQTIETSLSSDDPIVRLFAIMDKRVGKRRLQKVLSEAENQPAWLKVFYQLRLDTE